MGGGKGGSSTTTSSSTNTQTPPAYLDSAYQNIVQQAQGVAGTPLTQYPSSQMLAPFSSLQNQAFNAVQGAQGVANPYINAANSSIGASQTPLWANTTQFSPDQIQQYENPYQTDVVNSTMAEINQTNAAQQAQLQGNAISKGAWGGDRAGIAASSLANQQGLAANQTLAQLNNQNYAQASNEFNTQQQQQIGANEAQGWLNSQAGAAYGNLGNEAQSTALQGSNSLLNAGLLQQQQAQAGLNIPYEQYTQQQAYPFQTTSYLANLLEGIGGVAGGTTTGSGTSTSTQQGSALSNILGGAGGLTGILGETGAFGSSGYLTGSGASGTATPSAFSGATSLLDSYGSGGSGAAPVSSFFNKGGIVGRRHLAAGGLSGAIPLSHNVPDVGVDFIPSDPPSGVHANFPQPMQQQTQPQQSSGGGGGILGMLGGIFNRGGATHMAGGGGVYGSMSAARHSAPRVNIGKVPDLLKVPKFDDGGSVDGIGGLTPTAYNHNPVTQGFYQRYASMPTEKLQELNARSVGNPHENLVRQALRQKQFMPQQPTGVTPNPIATPMQPPNMLQTPSVLQTPSYSAGGMTASRGAYDDGGSVDNGISIPYPPPSGDPDLPQEIAAAGPSGLGQTQPSGIAASAQQQAPARHYQVPQSTEKPDPWMALLEGSMATLAGNGTAAQNIGRGVMTGLKEYSGQKKDIADRAYHQGEISDAVDRLNEEADYHRDNLNSEQQKIDIEKNKAQTDANYKQGLLQWRNSQVGGGKGGVTQSMVNDIMYDDDGGVRQNPMTGLPYTPEEALTTARMTAGATVGSDKNDISRRKDAADYMGHLLDNRTINDKTGKPYTKSEAQDEALGFYGVSPTAPTKKSGATKQPSDSAPEAPQAGDVVRGWKFKGGDPSQQSNWTKQ